MNDLERLYDIAKKENISINNYDWESVKSIIFEINNKYSIVLDRNLISSSLEEKQVLAEELGHYYCNALYYLTSDITLKSKCEYKAKKWAYSVLVPFKKLKEKIAQGLDLYDLADYFNVDCKYMNDCIDFYAEKYGILV